MKSYPQIVSKLFYEPLAITARKHAAICQVLERHMAGGVKAEHEEPDGDEEEDRSNAYRVFNGNAIIPVYGILGQHLSGLEMISGGCDVGTVGEMTELASADPSVKRIIYDFRTPGGGVTGLPETARKIASITSKETIGFTDSECCSGGLWLASQCQRFYCTPSADVGSIGVWCAYMDLSRQMANNGENMQAISAGKYKLLGAYWKPLTDEERAVIQAGVDKIYRQFKAAVNLRREIADEYMQGQIFDGEEAAQIGLVDGVIDDMGDLFDDSED